MNEMIEHVESGEGVVYNPISNNVMDEEESLAFIQYIEEQQEKTKSKEVSDNTLMYAFNKTKSINPLEEISLPPRLARGSNAPKTTIYLDNYSHNNPFKSNEFSGNGWRFSGYKFSFRNTKVNTLFGVRAHLDSYYFFDGMRNNVVPVSTRFVYYTSTFYGNALSGYFATYNPIRGSRYFIY